MKKTNIPSETGGSKPLGLPGSLLWFGFPALLLYLLTRFLIPALTAEGLNGIYAWYITAVLVMGSMFAAAVIAAAKPRLQSLRLKRLTGPQIRFTVIICLTALLATGVTSFLTELAMGPSETRMPSFLKGTTLERESQILLFLAWLPVFFFNMAGEELLWRGYLLPRQEARFGKHAWMLNGALWIVFHIPFGLRIILMLLPVFFLLPWMAQKTRNTWPGIILHVLVNGPSFILILLGRI